MEECRASYLDQVRYMRKQSSAFFKTSYHDVGNAVCLLPPPGRSSQGYIAARRLTSSLVKRSNQTAVLSSVIGYVHIRDLLEFHNLETVTNVKLKTLLTTQHKTPRKGKMEQVSRYVSKAFHTMTVEPVMLIDGACKEAMLLYTENVHMNKICSVKLGYSEEVRVCVWGVGGISFR